MNDNKRYLLKNIVWDTDDEGGEAGLPSRMTLEIEGSGLEGLTEAELEDYGFAGWLSDKIGYLVRSFDWKPLTPVRFLKEEFESEDGKSWTDSVIAVFPESEGKTSPGRVLTYAHMGQHSETSIPYVSSLPPASPEEYADLKKELEENIGYELEILP